MEENKLIHGDIINQFGQTLIVRHETNQAFVLTYFYTSLLDHGWNDKPERYFKQYSILKNNKEKNWECGIKATSLDCDKICILIHIDGNIGHWVLLVRFIKITHNGNVHLQCYYYDSLNNEKTMKGIEDKLMKMICVNIHIKYQ